MLGKRKKGQPDKPKKVSYIRKPLAKHSKWSLGLSAAGLILFAGTMYITVKEQGQSGMYAGALGFSSMVFSILGLWYSVHAFREKEKNYILARISLPVSGILVFAWLVMIMIGIRS